MDIFYLHAPDHNIPLEETLEAVQQLYKGQGKRSIKGSRSSDLFIIVYALNKTVCSRTTVQQNSLIRMSPHKEHKKCNSSTCKATVM